MRFNFRRTHSRDILTDEYLEQYEIVHEEDHPEHGKIGIAVPMYDTEHLVFWRKNRNITRLSTSYDTNTFKRLHVIGNDWGGRHWEAFNSIESAKMELPILIADADIPKKPAPRKITGSDSQRRKVYTWEYIVFKGVDDVKHTQESTLTRVDEIINEMNDVTGLDASVTVQFRSSGACSSASHHGVVKFLPSMLNDLTIIHELAHIYTFSLYNGVEGHGAEFVGVYSYMMNRFAGIKDSDITKSLSFKKSSYSNTKKKMVVRNHTVKRLGLRVIEDRFIEVQRITEEAKIEIERITSTRI